MNWPQLVADLIAAGMTQTEIAVECGVTQSTVSELARGVNRSPNFDLGTRLVALHTIRCKTPATGEAKAA
jgi:transcriptional regulator with XRE-family HTH domain